MGGVALSATTALGSAVLFAGPAGADTPSTPGKFTQGEISALGVVPTTKPAAVKKKPAAAKSKQQRRADTAVAFARKQIGDRYKWGGNGPSAWDCSGLATGAWRKAGVKLPRTTTAVYKKVRKKVSYRNLKPGDLVFFYSGRSHMGVYAGKGQMIHAPSSGKRVQKVKLSTYYKKQFNGAVRPG